MLSAHGKAEAGSPGTSHAGRENVAVPGGLVDSSTGGVPSSRVPDRLKWPFWEGADLILLGLDCCLPSPWRVPLRLIALLLLACTTMDYEIKIVTLLHISTCCSVIVTCTIMVQYSVASSVA